MNYTRPPKQGCKLMPIQCVVFDTFLLFLQAKLDSVLLLSLLESDLACNSIFCGLYTLLFSVTPVMVHAGQAGSLISLTLGGPLHFNGSCTHRTCFTLDEIYCKRMYKLTGQYHYTTTTMKDAGQSNKQ
jgi:hypothetical protein